jgi:hypothetical protein
MYREIFQRNYGVFNETEQKSIRNARVMIVGCGEVGGSAAILLARSGVEHFLLVDDDVFELSNINRQAGSYIDTLGMNKIDVLREEILRINPEADIELIKERIKPEDLARCLRGKDVLLSSADDFAYSIIASRIAKALCVPSVIGFPIGSLVRVWSSTEESPDIEEHFDLPAGLDYEELHSILTGENQKAVCGSWYSRKADWSAEWASLYSSSSLPATQIAPMTWIASSLAALEILKLITRRWEPVVFPRYWRITPIDTGIKEFVSHSDKDEGDEDGGDKGGGKLDAEQEKTLIP